MACKSATSIDDVEGGSDRRAAKGGAGTTVPDALQGEGKLGAKHKLSMQYLPPLTAQGGTEKRIHTL